MRITLAPAAPVTGDVALVVAPLDVIGKARLSRLRSDILEIPRRGPAFQCGPGQCARLPNAPSLPIGIEYLVEPLPIGTRRAEQGTKRRLQRGRPARQRASENRKSIRGLGQAGLEAIVAQRACKIGKPPAGGK